MAMERFVILLTWLAVAAVLIAALVIRHEPPRPTTPKGHRRGPSDRAAAV
jgi:hypothetical protein